MRVFLKSYGCAANLADGDVLAGCLREAGFELADSAKAADVLVFNCCAVKGPTEDRMIEVLKRVPGGKRLVVAGCLPLVCFGRLCREVRFDGVVGAAAGRRIVEVVRRVCGGEGVVALEGGLRWEADLGLGAREVWLTSQDNACYGRDIGSNLAGLLEAVCILPGDFRVRVGMMTPNFAGDMLDELVDAFRCEKVFKFLHLPVQSGDDEVLRRMCRFYMVQDFKRIVG